uniref:exo-alpha-sialidase n=1 Tax=Leptobrachium leishanense TaxID=445787 RepID=A0A8C5LW03_9ANUR
MSWSPKANKINVLMSCSASDRDNWMSNGCRYLVKTRVISGVKGYGIVFKAAVMAALDLPDTVTLFHRETNGITYRIPALIHIPDPPTFLAFAEMRSTPRDQDALHLVMRRGVESSGFLHWENITSLTSAKLPGHRTMNPCPVYDAGSGTVFLFFVCVRSNCSEVYQILTGRNAARICCVTSVDQGQTWSPLRDLTEEVMGDYLKNCATLAVGPGHGIQAQSGRLLVPAYFYYIHYRVCCLPVPFKTKSHSFVFYSDDHGKSWHKGNMLWNQTTGECEVAEVLCSNNTCLLYCTARTTRHYRVEAYSTSQGMAFGKSHLSKNLCEPPTGCQGSVVTFYPPEECGGTEEPDGGCDSETSGLQKKAMSWLLYSHPTSRKKRENLGVYLNKSPLVFSSWSQPWIINEGPSAYSDLAVCRDLHSFGCLFECGENACEKITFRRFTVEELLKNISTP